MADPYAFMDATGNVMGTYADPSSEFGSPGWSYQDAGGNTLATYADPYAEFGWGAPAPIWGGYDSPRSFMYGLGAQEPGFFTPTPTKVVVVGGILLYLLSRSRTKSHLLPHFMRNPLKRKSRKHGRRRRARAK